MGMIVKLCIIMGLMGVAAVVLNRLFPANKDNDAPRTLNDLMHEVDIEDDTAEDAEAEEATEDDAGDSAELTEE